MDMPTAAQTCPYRERAPGDEYHFYSLLTATDSIATLKAAVLKALGVMKFDSFSFAPVGVDKPRRLSNWPDELQAQYEQCRDHDLIARHAETNTSPVYLSTIADYIERAPVQLESNAKFLALTRVAAGHGLRDSYNIPYQTPLGVNWLLSVTSMGSAPSELQALVEAHQGLLYFLGDILSNIALSRYSAHFFGSGALHSKYRITPKQLQLLNILAKSNVTLHGAAEAMFISLDTANKHMAAIKAALGAKTQAVAVYRGIVAGLVEIDSKTWK